MPLSPTLSRTREREERLDDAIQNAATGSPGRCAAHDDDLDPIYRRLMDAGVGEAFDRHVFACAVALAATEADRPLTAALGLPAAALGALFATYFPGETALRAGVPDDAGEDALEEPDLRALLLECGTCRSVEEEWLAAIVARRSLGANHLWQDLGLFRRDELSRLFRRHFRPLALRNSGDMKWKKFFYRELCQCDGVFVCKAPNLCGLRRRLALLRRRGRRAARPAPGHPAPLSTAVSFAARPASGEVSLGTGTCSLRFKVVVIGFLGKHANTVIK